MLPRWGYCSPIHRVLIGVRGAQARELAQRAMRVGDYAYAARHNCTARQNAAKAFEFAAIASDRVCAAITASPKGLRDANNPELLPAFGLCYTFENISSLLRADKAKVLGGASPAGRALKGGEIDDQLRFLPYIFCAKQDAPTVMQNEPGDTAIRLGLELGRAHRDDRYPWPDRDRYLLPSWELPSVAGLEKMIAQANRSNIDLRPLVVNWWRWKDLATANLPYDRELDPYWFGLEAWLNNSGLPPALDEVPRLPGRSEQARSLTYLGLTANSATFEVRYEQRSPISLNGREWELLWLLMERKDEFTPDELAIARLNIDTTSKKHADNSLSHVRTSIRRWLKPFGRTIKTMRNRGCRLDEARDSQAGGRRTAPARKPKGAGAGPRGSVQKPRTRRPQRS